MAKIATQTIVIQISKAVRDNASDTIEILGIDELTQMIEAVEALANDPSAVVELNLGE